MVAGGTHGAARDARTMERAHQFTLPQRTRGCTTDGPHHAAPFVVGDRGRGAVAGKFLVAGELGKDPHFLAQFAQGRGVEGIEVQARMKQVDHGGLQFGGLEDVFEKGQADAKVGEGGRGGRRGRARVDYCRHGRLGFQRKDEIVSNTVTR